MKIGFVSLGCSKNLVVTEEMIGLFKKHGYLIVSDVAEAYIILINTCGFIESAKDEGIKTILEMADYKEQNCQFLIVTGCLVERYKEELVSELPEVDLFVRIRDYDDLWNEINKLVLSKNDDDQLSYKNRVITTGEKMAYLKIAEGCSNFCTYCAIPYIQGKYISRPYEEILDEAKILSSKGIEELVVIAQDTTKYGFDLYGKGRLAELLHDLEQIDGFRWIRFLYSYPETIDDDLIEVVKNSKKICHYFDLPIQHISTNVLKRMNRKSDSESIKNLVMKLRKEIPDVVLRTTLIVGFPGETQADFDELCDFVKSYKMDRLGAFMYSAEDGTPAAKFPNQISSRIKKERQKIIMKLQQEVSRNNLANRIGEVYTCLVEDITNDGNFYIGRTQMDVKDEDGVIFIKNMGNIMINEFVNVRIVASREYDLIAEVIDGVVNEG